MCVYIYTHIGTCTHTHVHTRTHTYTHMHTRTHTHAHAHTCTHACTHTHTYTHAHAYVVLQYMQMCHTHSTWKTTKAYRRMEKKHLLSRESYELTWAKAFDMWWSSMVKEQSETLAHTMTMGLQQGCTPKWMFNSQYIAKISMTERYFTYFCSLPYIIKYMYIIG